MSEELKKYQNQVDVINTKIDFQTSSVVGVEPSVGGS